MDVVGEALHPAKSHLLQLATTNGIDRSRALDTIQKIVDVASEFKSFAKDYQIRRTTVNDIARAIQDNCARMA